MTEHEKLKLICDKIGYESYYEFDGKHLLTGIDAYCGTPITANIREIIFTPEFMNNFNHYISIKDHEGCYWNNLYGHLDNPVEYLYNLLTN